MPNKRDVSEVLLKMRLYLGGVLLLMYMMLTAVIQNMFFLGEFERIVYVLKNSIIIGIFMVIVMTITIMILETKAHRESIKVIKESLDSQVKIINISCEDTYISIMFKGNDRLHLLRLGFNEFDFRGESLNSPDLWCRVDEDDNFIIEVE